MTDPLPITGLIATIDRADFPIDLQAITGDQVARLREAPLNVDINDLVRVIEASEVTAHEAAALAVLSLEQQDEPADARWLLRHITLGSSIELVAITPDEPEPAAPASAPPPKPRKPRKK